MQPDIQIVDIDLDTLDLDDDTRALLESCLPEHPVDIAALLTQERIDEALIASGLVEAH